MAKVIIDGKDTVFGRLCSYAAKKALGGDEVIIINSDKVIITGNKKDIINKYRTLKAKGGRSLKGPKYSRLAYRMLKRGIRGMLPNHRKGIGKQAFSRIKCYESIPKEFEGKETIKLKTRKPNKFIELKELSNEL